MSVSSIDSGCVSPSPRIGVNDSRATRGMPGMLGRPDQVDLVAGSDVALLQDRGIPPCVLGMGSGRDPAVAAVDEPASLRVAWVRVVGELQQRAGAPDAHPFAGPDSRPVEPKERGDLAVGAGERLVPDGPDSIDGLDRVEAV